MPSASRVIDISFATFLRALVAAALVWIWWRLWQWVLVFVLAVVLAVALDPLVSWMEKRGLRRPLGAVLTALVLVVVTAAFFVASGTSIAHEARIVGGQLTEFRETVLSRIPSEIREAGQSLAPSGESFAGVARAFTTGVAGVALALVVTVYLLVDGRRTYLWVAAFAPRRHRPRVHETALRARDVVAAYVRGNVITSVLCAVCTWVALAALGVPAAFVLALLSGILDFVPVIGFLLSAAPAILLGATVSATVALGVAVFFVAYNVVENYYIQPKVYGRELRLSNLAVVIAFLVGAELGGVLGALLSLPLAAMYPVVERLWFQSPDRDDTADAHRRIEAQPEH